MDREDIITICKACGEVTKMGGVLWCKLCKCNIQLKATIGPALNKRCPLRKW